MSAYTHTRLKSNKYAYLDSLMGSRDRRKVKNNTYARRIDTPDGPRIAVRLHDTDVVILAPDGGAELHSGGWETVTTKDRLNDFGPARVFADRGEWFVYEPERDGLARRVAFFDGIRVDASGVVLNAPEESAAAERDALEKTYRKLVAAFVRKAVRLAESGELPDPSGGDCWGCYFAVQGEHKPHDPAGQDPLGNDHIAQHLAEEYVVPSLCFRAIREAGYRDPALIWAMARGTHGFKVAQPDMIAQALRKFFKARKPQTLKDLPGALASVAGYDEA